MTCSLIWHLATYTEGFGSNGFPEPHRHRLISLAGISVDLGEHPEARIWAVLSKEPAKLLLRLDQELGQVDEIVTLNGANFGLPVIRCNALTHDVVLENFAHPPHLDLAEEIIGGFDTLTNVFNLPARAKLDVKQAWEAEEHHTKIAKRLMCDCVLIALAFGRYRRMLGEIPPGYYELYEQAVLDAAGKKTAWVGKVFDHGNE